MLRQLGAITLASLSLLSCTHTTTTAATNNVSADQTTHTGLNAAGLTHKQTRDFLLRLQRLVNDTEMSAPQKQQQLATLIAYPLRTPGCKGAHCPTINNAETLVRQFHTVFTQDTLKAIAKQDSSRLFINYQGVMIGRGQVWYGFPSSHATTIKIIAINH